MGVILPHAAATVTRAPPVLQPGERLLLASLRGWAGARVAGEAPHAPIRAGLARATSPRTAALFVALMDSLEAGCLRPLEIHRACCPGYSTDEQRLVLACGICPVADDIAAALLRPLVADAAPMLVLARSLNAALATDGFDLPVRLLDEVAEASTQTLH